MSMEKVLWDLNPSIKWDQLPFPNCLLMFGKILMCGYGAGGSGIESLPNVVVVSRT
jgi:hypothetical protein